MNAEETEWDWTTARGWESKMVWNGGWHRVEEIVSIDSDPYAYNTYTDTDHGDDTLWQPPSEFVNRFECVGDTDGDDVGSDTGMDVYLDPIKLTVRRGDYNLYSVKEIDRRQRDF